MECEMCWNIDLYALILFQLEMFFRRSDMGPLVGRVVLVAARLVIIH